MVADGGHVSPCSAACSLLIVPRPTPTQTSHFLTGPVLLLYSILHLLVFYMPRATKKPRTGKKCCPVCEKDFYPQAFGAHVKKCERIKRAQDGLMVYERQLEERLYADLSSMCSSPLLHRTSHFFLERAPGALMSAHTSNAPGDPGSPPVLTPPEIEGKDYF